MRTKRFSLCAPPQLKSTSVSANGAVQAFISITLLITICLFSCAAMAQPEVFARPAVGPAYALGVHLRLRLRSLLPRGHLFRRHPEGVGPNG